jgi:hypothetical protein
MGLRSFINSLENLSPARPEQEARRVADFWEELIAIYLSKQSLKNNHTSQGTSDSLASSTRGSLF